jgi:large subunit ribosomal protein L13
MTKTFVAKPEQVVHQWYVVDAEGATLGRLAREIAVLLRGKHKPIYTPHVDTGDCVVVVNAAKVAFSGNKIKELQYRHSGYPGGLKWERKDTTMARHPERMVREAVRGMLPHNTLGRIMLRKLKVYRGAEHPHTAQQPEPLALDPKVMAVSRKKGAA